MSLPLLIVIAGPTAVGKSEVAAALARRVEGEVVSCDAMQVYREIPVTTGRPSASVLSWVPHHMLGVLSVREPCDAAAFARRAEPIVEGIAVRGKVPILCGGSGMYLRVLLRGIFPQGAVPEVRRLLLERAESEGPLVLYEELRRVDPEAAARIHPHDLRRVVRALEVFQAGGRPISVRRREGKGLGERFDIRGFVLHRPRPELYARIDARVRAMAAEGLVEEIRALDGVPLSHTACRAIGVAEIRAWMGGEISFEEAVARMQRNTRRYAKRQLTWFRRETGFVWIEADAAMTAEELAVEIQGRLGRMA